MFKLNKDGNFWCLNGDSTEFRMLSTKSSVKGNGEHGVTYWKWYWQNSKDEWVEYQDWVCNLSYLVSFMEYHLWDANLLCFSSLAWVILFWEH